MILKWRDWFFQGNANDHELVQNPIDLEMVRLLLGEQHYGILLRDFKEGFDSQRPGNDKAWKKPNHPGASEGRLKLLQDFCKQAQERRSFLFSSGNKSVMKILRESYLRLNPIDTTNKNWSDGKIQYDTDGQPKKRPLTDCTARGDVHAPNYGISSFGMVVQQMTSWQAIVWNLLRLESWYPHVFKVVERENISNAFRRIGTHLRDKGVYAHEFEGVVNYTLTLTFGGRASPSAWETHSSAIEKCFNRAPCVEQPEPAQLARFVDDMQLSIAMTTHQGGETGTQRLKAAMEKVANKDALNGEKTVVLTVTNNFGAMIDTSLRLVSTPWLKILKFGHAVHPLISGESKTLNLGQIHSIIGLSSYTVFWVWHLSSCRY